MKFTDVAGIMNIPYVAEKVKLSHVAEIVKLSHVAGILEAGSMYDPPPLEKYHRLLVLAIETRLIIALRYVLDFSSPCSDTINCRR